jgi:hypothetical protein
MIERLQTVDLAVGDDPWRERRFLFRREASTARAGAGSSEYRDTPFDRRSTDGTDHQGLLLCGFLAENCAVWSE